MVSYVTNHPFINIEVIWIEYFLVLGILSNYYPFVIGNYNNPHNIVLYHAKDNVSIMKYRQLKRAESQYIKNYVKQ